MNSNKKDEPHDKALQNIGYAESCEFGVKYNGESVIVAYLLETDDPPATKKEIARSLIRSMSFPCHECLYRFNKFGRLANCFGNSALIAGTMPPEYDAVSEVIEKGMKLTGLTGFKCAFILPDNKITGQQEILRSNGRVETLPKSYHMGHVASGKPERAYFHPWIRTDAPKETLPIRVLKSAQRLMSGGSGFRGIAKTVTGSRFEDNA